MALFSLHEPIIDALVTRLQADLPAAIATLNGTVTDGWPLEEPAQILDYVPTDGRLGAFPTIAIQDVGVTLENDVGSSAESRTELGIVYFLRQQDPQGMARQLRRYGRVIASVALAGRSLPPQGWGTGYVRWVPGPTLEVQEDPRTWMTWAAVIIWAKGDESSI